MTVAALLALGTGALWAREGRLRPSRRPRGSDGPAAFGISPQVYGSLAFRFIGPLGNRVSAVAGVPGNPLVYYAGAASGGIFKTVDGGMTWRAIFDREPVSSIGSLAVSPSDPHTVWAGTGEAWIRSNISMGWGIYKSTNAGQTWTRMGLEKTGRIGRIVASPSDPGTVFACALGNAYGPQAERGVFRTTDGGRTWQKVLFVDENTGCSDVAMDPKDPHILFAGMWQFVIHTWGQYSGGPGSGLFRSSDGGSTWTRLAGHGLPDQEMGKIGLAIAPGDGQRVYAIIETGTGEPFEGHATAEGELWRSDDGGQNWRMMNPSHNVAGRPPYYSRMAVNPDNENELYFLTASYSVSKDGGESLKVMRAYPDTSGGHIVVAPPLGDYHDMWIDPTNGQRMVVSNDGGIGITVNDGETWKRVEFPNAQIYHVAVDNRIPYFVYGNRQDGPSVRGPSNSLVFGYDHFAETIGSSEWNTVGGGESGWAIPDPVDANVVYASGSAAGPIGGLVDRYDQARRQYRSVEVWPDDTEGFPAGAVKYRFYWTFPLAIDPLDHNKVFAGSQFVHMTANGGQSWKAISPDLTLNDKSRQGVSGGLTGDNIGAQYGDTLMAIAPSPIKEGVIWTGTNDGQVSVTRDGGLHWANVSKNISGLPPWGTIYCVEPSPFEASSAYITVDLHQQDDFDPYVYKTSDFGRTWTRITNGIPRSPLSYAHSIKEDPFRRGLLFLGTENALYVSFDDGANWLPFQNNLPHVPIYGITVQKHFHDLVLATYGRGFWILDDLRPLEQISSAVLGSQAHLFMPRPAYRYRGYTPNIQPSYEPAQGFNPPYGADIDYYLNAPGNVTISVVNANGDLLRTLRASNHAGLNRVWWNLQSDPQPAAPILVRTSPLYARWMKPGPNGRAARSGISLLVPPGKYTIKLVYGDLVLQEPLTVIKDPHSGGTVADILSQISLLRKIQAELKDTGAMIDEVELVRGQLENLPGDEPANPAIASAEAQLDQRFLDFEEQLTDVRVTGGQDSMRWPAGLLEKLFHLAGQVQPDDFPPTDQEAAVNGLFTSRIRRCQQDLEQLVGSDVARFNMLLKEQNDPPIRMTAPGQTKADSPGGS